MTKAEFNRIVAEGRDMGKCYMVVKIQAVGTPGPEIIVNPAENFDAKLSYYNHAYNDDMELIAAKNNGKIIRIVDVCMISNFTVLNWFIY